MCAKSAQSRNYKNKLHTVARRACKQANEQANNTNSVHTVWQTAVIRYTVIILSYSTNVHCVYLWRLRLYSVHHQTSRHFCVSILENDHTVQCNYDGMVCLDRADLVYPRTTIMQPWRTNGLVCNCVPSCSEHEIKLVGRTTTWVYQQPNKTKNNMRAKNRLFVFIFRLLVDAIFPRCCL